MATDLKGIGDMLRSRRKELNMSLKDVENSTSIRSGYLQAIEEGQMEKLISPIYAQGFVKQYAIYLGLDGERLVADGGELFKKPIHQDFAYGIGTLEPRGNHGAGVKWMPGSLWIVAFFVVMIVAYYVARMLEVL
ncbi:MAG: helix-turn-helix domain-containing protein [Verrucomicrobia bacterium]|nr:helix-turn-helix domain-containing protein [Verrucomicrobiota bacterium]MBS0637096.1 helix-turn-helix domain-containing protein [Verrucomicrobiota bacterium]